MYYDYFIKDTLSKDKNKYLFDIPILAKHKLLCCDLVEKNIYVLPYDTYSNKHLFFSYRNHSIQINHIMDANVLYINQ